MIVNHKYKFIFIKSFKTASTSLEIALSKFCDKNDIITPIVIQDEKIRQKLNFNSPQNYKGFEEHMTALEVKNKLDAEIFNNYFKFIVVRNPFEQIISAYYWHNESKKKERKFLFFRKKPLSFNKFFKRKAQHIFYDEINRYTDNGKVIIDGFIKYENFENDLIRISNLLKLPENLYEIFKNIRAKSNIKPPIEKRIKLTQEHKIKIMNYAKKIIALHEYKI